MKSSLLIGTRTFSKKVEAYMLSTLRHARLSHLSIPWRSALSQGSISPIWHFLHFPLLKSNIPKSSKNLIAASSLLKRSQSSMMDGNPRFLFNFLPTFPMHTSSTVRIWVKPHINPGRVGTVSLGYPSLSGSVIKISAHRITSNKQCRPGKGWSVAISYCHTSDRSHGRRATQEFD
jgi:hypothetical protein